MLILSFTLINNDLGKVYRDKQSTFRQTSPSVISPVVIKSVIDNRSFNVKTKNHKRGRRDGGRLF